MKNKFIKNIFTFRKLIGDIAFLTLHIPQIIGAFRDKEIDKAFTERIMFVITAVNGCVYCAWFHAKRAVASGMSEEEVKDLLDLQFKAQASDYEIMALLYAQHYAETNREPDPEMTEKFNEYYGEKTANHIFMIIRMIYFGNLLGNTWDAIISRFEGNPVENSSVIFEFFFFSATFLFMVSTMFQMKERKELPFV